MPVTGRATYSVVMRPAAEFPENSRRSSTSWRSSGSISSRIASERSSVSSERRAAGGPGVHRFGEAGALLGVGRFDEGLLHLRPDLFEGLGRNLFVERDEEGLAL